jgi:hypothetical protein
LTKPSGFALRSHTLLDNQHKPYCAEVAVSLNTWTVYLADSESLQVSDYDSDIFQYNSHPLYTSFDAGATGTIPTASHYAPTSSLSNLEIPVLRLPSPAPSGTPSTLFSNPLEPLVAAAQIVSASEDTQNLVTPPYSPTSYEPASPLSTELSYSELTTTTTESHSDSLIAAEEPANTTEPTPQSPEYVCVTPTPQDIAELEERQRRAYSPELQYPDPAPLSPLPQEEEARLENQENIPPVPPVVGPEPLPFPPTPCPPNQIPHPHEFLSVSTRRRQEWRQAGEISIFSIHDIPTLGDLCANPPVFPSVIPFRARAAHILNVVPNHREFLPNEFPLSIPVCCKAVRYLPGDGIPLGYIRYHFQHHLARVFGIPAATPSIKAAFIGSIVILDIYDFLDGRIVTVFGYLAFDQENTFVVDQGYQCEDLVRSTPGLLAYTLTPRIPVDPLDLVEVHLDVEPLRQI